MNPNSSQQHSAFCSPPLRPRSASPTLGFADALLCLIGAAVFYLAATIYRDELDLAELPQRSRPRASRASSLRERIRCSAR